jgi:hypothetical protein
MIDNINCGWGRPSACLGRVKPTGHPIPKFRVLPILSSKINYIAMQPQKPMFYSDQEAAIEDGSTCAERNMGQKSYPYATANKPFNPKSGSFLNFAAEAAAPTRVDKLYRL